MTEAVPAAVADTVATGCSAVVVAADASMVELRVQPVAGCGACARGVGCGQALGAGRQRDRLLRLPRPAHLEIPSVDSRVHLVLTPRRLLAAACTAYGWPLAGLFAGAATGALLVGGDPGVIGGSLAGLVGGFLVARVQARRHVLGWLPEFAGDPR